MKKIGKQIFRILVWLVAVIGVLPVVEASTIFSFAGENLYYLILLTMAYLAITTEAEIFAILDLYERGDKSKKISKLQQHISDWGKIGMFFLTAFPLLGSLAAWLFAKDLYKLNGNKAEKTRLKIWGRVCIYLGYLVRILWLGKIAEPFVNFLKNVF